MLEKKIHRFYIFELMIHSLTAKDFLNMDSDILLSITPGV